jgi:hypothetical protein
LPSIHIPMANTYVGKVKCILSNKCRSKKGETIV